MKEKVLCCNVCGEDLLLEQRPMLKEQGDIEGYCLCCRFWWRLDKAVWKEVDIES